MRDKDIKFAVEKKLFFRWFIICVIFLYIFAFIAIYLSKGENWDCLIWHAESIGLFPDLSLSVWQIKGFDPYSKSVAVYPPFAYLCLAPLAYLIPGEVSLLTSYNPVDSTVYYLFFSIVVALIMLAFFTYILSGTKMKFLFFLGFVLSAPFLFCIERGNIVIVSVLLCCYYIFNYDSKNEIKKEFALIALALAVALKLYPVVLGLLLIINKKYKDAVHCAIYGIIIFLFPFFLLRNSITEIVNCMVSDIRYLTDASTENLVDWGYSFRIGVTAIVYSYGQYLNIENNTLKLIVAFLSFAMIIVLVITAFVVKDNIPKVMALIMIIVYIPGFSWIYNTMYFLPVLFLLNKHYKKVEKLQIKDIIYIILLLLLFVPLPYGKMFESLYGVQKISINTFTTNLSLSLLLICLIIEMIKSLSEKKTDEVGKGDV